MTPYRIQEADFQVPATWQDQSINIFKLPAVGDAKEASFIISRDSSQGDVSFAEYVAEQLRSAERQLPGFELIQTWHFVLNGCAASLLDYSWQREGRELMLRQVYVEQKPTVLILTLTTTRNDLIYHEAAWKQVVHSFSPGAFSA
ncbi:DcrB-related protein [Pseudomonas sp. NPDC087358]|uniref:DcrB-related protein n=1 Tax=Pseudomonas sp. NPDC087358 TaxID=3364439 RepID=UPI00384D579E